MHRFNSADKSPAGNRHPQHPARKKKKNLLQNPSRKAAGGCVEPSATGCRHAQGALCVPGQVPPAPRPCHPQTKALCSPLNVGWVRVARSCCRRDPNAGGWGDPNTGIPLLQPLLGSPHSSSSSRGSGQGEQPPLRAAGLRLGPKGGSGAFWAAEGEGGPAGHRTGPIPGPIPIGATEPELEERSAGRGAGDGNVTPTATFHPLPAPYPPLAPPLP